MRIRMNVLCDSFVDGAAYLGRDGSWTTWSLAATFRTAAAAERFARRHGVELYGIF